MDIKAIVNMEKGHCGHFLIYFESSLTGTFISTSKSLKTRKAAGFDLT